ncbi:MAG: lysine--tRNA ligase [Planctomycetes bacterium]|nr:lysine--tRNA ligase [Planctomycetota bacterium]
MSEANEYRQAREAKRDALAALGVNPYEVRTPARALTSVLKAAFEAVEAKGAEGAKVEGRAIAGRVLANRKMGKAVFLDVYDGSGRMQVYLNAKGVGEPGMKIHENLDLGDFIWARGDVQRTRTGEVTLFASELRFLTKALSVPPLPREFTDEAGVKQSIDALTDPELRHRKRYLDLMVHADVRARFEKRSVVVRAVRRFLEEQGYLEVETPMMHPIPGGARARPFITHHNTLHMNLYLRIAPELYLKRLLVGGFERVFEINRNFRNEGIDHTHNPEFTMMELYEAYGDYESMMRITEGMFRESARAVRAFERGVDPSQVADSDLVFQWGGRSLDLGKPFARRKYADLLREYAGVDLHAAAGVRAKAEKLGLELKEDHYMLADAVLEATVQDKLVQPTFLIDYPTAICPLTKAKPDDPRICERFELFICGVEFANAFSELNEPVEQLKRFKEQVDAGLKSEDLEAPKEIDHDYVEALEAGMPPAGGLGVGIDRMVMMLTDTDSIREVILFPHMRRDHADAAAAATQRARIAAETLLEELQSPELRKHKDLVELAEKARKALG